MKIQAEESGLRVENARCRSRVNWGFECTVISLQRFVTEEHIKGRRPLTKLFNVILKELTKLQEHIKEFGKRPPPRST